MNEPKRHHYLPQFYLKTFADDGQLWVFDREDREYRRQTPYNTAVQREYYTVVDKSGSKNRELERILARIEGRAADAIRVAEAQQDLSDEQRAAIAVFVALLKVRVPNFEKAFAEAGEKLFKKVMKSTINTEERAAASIAAYERDTGNDLALSPKELLEFFQTEAFTMEMHRNQTISTMIELSAEFAVLLVQMDWVFLHAPKRTSFTTSDVPFGVIPPGDWDSKGIGGVGLVTPGAIKVVPLTQSTTLFMLDQGDETLHRDLSQEQVRDLNLRVTARTERFAIARDKALLENLVTTTGIDRGGHGPRIQVH